MEGGAVFRFAPKVLFDTVSTRLYSVSMPLTKEQLVDALREANGNISGAARRLGMSRQTIHTWIKRFDVEISVEVTVGQPTLSASEKLYRQKQIAAISAVGAAVKSGRLTRKPCEVCGSEKVEAHHHLGYEKEYHLDIRWLCHSHHRQIHKNGKGTP